MLSSDNSLLGSEENFADTGFDKWNLAFPALCATSIKKYHRSQPTQLWNLTGDSELPVHSYQHLRHNENYIKWSLIRQVGILRMENSMHS